MQPIFTLSRSYILMELFIFSYSFINFYIGDKKGSFQRLDKFWTDFVESTISEEDFWEVAAPLRFLVSPTKNLTRKRINHGR